MRLVVMVNIIEALRIYRKYPTEIISKPSDCVQLYRHLSDNGNMREQI